MDEAHQHHRRWPWVLLITGILIIATFFFTHWVWSKGAGNRLARQVAAYKAAGEPIEPGDFIPAAIPDEDNAAIDLRAAAAAVDQGSDLSNAFDKLEPQLPLTDTEIKTIAAYVAANAAALNSIDDAMAKKGIDWKLAIKSPTISILLPDLSQQRNLALILRNRALLEHTRGDHAAALRDIRRIQFLAAAVDKQVVFISTLVATGMRALGADAVQQMAPELKIGAEKGAASPQQVKELISAFLEDQPLRDSVRRGFQGERMLELDTARCIADGTLNISTVLSRGVPAPAPPAMQALSFAVRPIALDDGVIMIRHTTGMLTSFEKSPNWPTYQKLAPPYPAEVLNNRYRHALASMMIPSLQRGVLTVYRVMTDQHLSAVALAMRQYRLDHDGRWPAKLEELVPAYLPRVPVDLMTAGAPLKYLASKQIVYSVGDNLVDDSGNETSLRRATLIGDRWTMQDAVVHLTLQPRPPEQDMQVDSGVDKEHQLPSAPPPIRRD